MAISVDADFESRAKFSPDNCSLSKAWDVLGKRASVMIIREAFLGATRFDQFAARVGITDAAVSARLKELVAVGVFEKVPYGNATIRPRYNYVLTERGEQLLPVILGLNNWGAEHLDHDGGPLTFTAHGGKQVEVRVVTVDEGPRPVRSADIQATPNRPWFENEKKYDQTAEIA